MKAKNIYTYLTALLVFSTTGCKKFLDQPVLGQYQSTNFFTSDANAILAVNAAYSPLTFTDPSTNAIWVLGDVASDDVIKGASAGDQADFGNIDTFNIIPSNAAVEAVWTRYYDGVFKCNVVTDGLTGNTQVSAAVQSSVIGQAEFLRAYYYFNLTVAYGKIPLHLKVETPAELQSPALPQATIFAQIEKDCTAAAAVLPVSYTAPGDIGRATKGAALALLAKTYLFEQKWALAASTAQAVDALGVYSLLPVYADNFKQATKNNAEGIFTVQEQTGLVPAQGNGLNQWFAPISQNGYGFFLPTQSLVNNYEVSSAGVVDPRENYTIAQKGGTYFGVPFDPAWSSTGYISLKHVQPLTEIPTTIKGDGNLNYEAIRFADVLLIEAEALNESGNSAGALVPLNRIRKRARESYLYDPALMVNGVGTVPAGLLPDITIADQTSLRDIIRRERRTELALEFHRYFDLIRYGSAYATAALSDQPNFNFNTDEFFPIPESERQTNLKLGL